MTSRDASNNVIDWPICRDIITGRLLITTQDFPQLFKPPTVLECIEELSVHLTSDDSLVYTHTSDKHGLSPSSPVDIYLKGATGDLHPAILTGEVAMMGSPTVPPMYGYFRCGVEGSQPYHSHALIQWCRGYVDNLYHTHRG